MRFFTTNGNYEKRLIKRAKSGDKKAFAELYQKYNLIIYRYILAQVGSPQDAEDLTTEVFIKAWNSLDTYADQGYTYGSFLFRVARNTIIDFVRNQKKENILDIETPFWLQDDSDLPSDILSKKEDYQKLYESINRLPDDYKEVLILRFFSDLSVAETAEFMNRSSGAIRILQHRALNALRSIIEESRE